MVDLVDRLTFPFPGFAAFTLLGFPEEDTDMLKNWSANRILFTYGRLADEESQVAIAARDRRLLALLRGPHRGALGRAPRRPHLDLIMLSREKPEQLNEFDIVNMVYSMALAGHETTCNTIGSGIRALLEHREQYQELVEDPSKIENAVEEILRFDGPVLNHRRLAKVDTEVAGVSIPAGAKVMMCFASADHDPAQFEDPDQFDISRENAELHLAFGKGPHFCLGAPLGRLETRIVLELLTTHLPDLALVPGESFDYSPNALFRGPRQLLVTTGAAR